MTLLHLTKIKYEFQQVNTPVSTGPGNASSFKVPKKEDYLEMSDSKEKSLQNLVEALLLGDAFLALRKARTASLGNIRTIRTGTLK